MAGTWCTNQFGFKPQLTTQGTTDKADFDTSMDRIDAKLGEFRVVGDPGYDDLATALTTIGSTPTVLRVGPNNVQTVTAATVIPANVVLDDGPYQIFNCTGAGSVDVSASPVSRIPFAWYGALKGAGHDNAAILELMAYLLGMHQSIYFDGGSYYRIATAVSIAQTQTLGFTGDSMTGSKIYIDVGAGNDGLTLTSGAGYAGYWFRDIGVVGPSSCCRRGINIYDSAPLQMDNVALFMGATSYALALDNVVYTRLNNVDIGHFNAYPIFSGCARPNDGIGFLSTTGYGANVVDALVYISGMAGNGIYMTGGSNVTIKGSIEACNYPVYVQGGESVTARPWAISFDNVNMIDGNTHGMYVDAVNMLNLSNCIVYGDSTISRVRRAVVRSTDFNELTVKADVVDISFDNCSVEVQDSFVCDAQNATFITPMLVTQQSDVPYPGAMSELKNHIQNSTFERWDSVTGIMAGWGDGGGGGTHTQCGEGLADTTRHIASYCDLANTDGNAAIAIYYDNFSGAALNNLLGKYCTASIWVYPTNTGSSVPTLYIESTVAAWGSGTYKVNDFVIDATSTYTFKCVVGGTTDALEPTWNTNYQQHTTDGGVTWVRANCGNYSRGSSSTLATNAWSQLAAGAQVPQNATNVTVYILLWQATGGVDVDYYVAEPCLSEGGAPRQFIGSYNQFSSGVQVAANRVTWGATVPASGWAQQGDVHWYTGASSGNPPGAVCVTSGVNGVGASWKDMANLA